MNNIEKNNLDQIRDTETLYSNLLSIAPTPVSRTVPSNGSEQKRRFLDGDIDTPKHDYPKLDSYSSHEDILLVGHELISSVSDVRLQSVYQNFVDGYALTSRIMLAMNDVRANRDDQSGDGAQHTFMQLNIEKYGKPDQDTYESILCESIRSALSMRLSGTALTIQNSLADYIPAHLVEKAQSNTAPERFKPSQSTIDWMSNVAHELYGGMLEKVPEREVFTIDEVQSIFQSIIENDFAESAEGWSVVIEPAKSINVKSDEKKIVIPEDRGEITYSILRGLIVHEIGIHMMRSVTGASTNVGPMAHGLSEYYEAEEGLGVVMEQALKSEFTESGVNHYITAGAAYYENMDFRQLFEMKWRLIALSRADQNGELSDEIIQKSRSAAYAQVMRSLRGTDTLPWFKDLSYYNGAIEIWKYVEQIEGDDLQLSLLLQGKVNTSKQHQRVVLESKSV